MSTKTASKTITDHDSPSSQFLVAREPRGKVDRFLDSLSFLLSPILIKEARQAIKSRQLAVTLTLLFLAVLVWSIACAVNARVAQMSEAEQSSVTINGFALCLALPLFIVVPFWSFSSMSNEIDETTYDLILCTTLKPWQIVAGKLSAALAQMMIYLAVVAPCFAFCAVLPGTNLPGLTFVLATYTAFSIGLSALGLLMGTPRSQVWRVFSMVLFFALLLACFGFAVTTTFTFFGSVTALDYQNWDDMVWSAYIGTLFGFVAGPIGLGILFAAIAVGAVSPKSSNRSTPVRLAVCVCWFILAKIMILTSFYIPDGSWFIAQVLITGIFVLVVGGWLLGERAELSRRVRRQLPTSTWGDMLVCWLLPGPGRGFVFAGILYCGFLILHPASIMLLYYAGIYDQLSDLDDYAYGFEYVDFAPNNYPWWFTFSMGMIAMAYLGAYLATVWAINIALSKLKLRVNPVGSLFITAIVIIASFIAWAIVNEMFYYPSRYALEWYDQMNVVVVLEWWYRNFERGPGNPANLLVFARVLFLPGTITLVALIFAAKELQTSRLATPDAVIADDLANQPDQPKEISFDDID